MAFNFHQLNQWRFGHLGIFKFVHYFYKGLKTQKCFVDLISKTRFTKAQGKKGLASTYNYFFCAEVFLQSSVKNISSLNMM